MHFTLGYSSHSIRTLPTLPLSPTDPSDISFLLVELEGQLQKESQSGLSVPNSKKRRHKHRKDAGDARVTPADL